MSRPTGPAAEQVAPPRRDPVPSGARIALWDNARFVLILLVVFGHAIEGIRGAPEVDAVYAVVYAFHIPAFMLVSGWFARSDRLDGPALAGTARLLVTWLIAEAAWLMLRWLSGKQVVGDTFLVTPSWTLWFLVALFCMRVALPYLAQLRLPILVAVLIALAAGLSALIGTEFSASRTLAMLPFFVIGWWLRRAGVGDAAWFRVPSVRLRLAAGAVAVLVVAGVVVLSRTPDFTFQLLFWRRDYAEMDFSDPTGLLLRGLWLVIGLALTLALLILLPRGRTWLSAAGRNTLAVYLLHAPVVFLMRQLQIDDMIGGLPGALLVMLAIAVALTLLTASAPAARMMRPITEPDWVFRRPVAP